MTNDVGQKGGMSLKKIDNGILKTILRNKTTKGDPVSLHPSLQVQLYYSTLNQMEYSEDNIKAYETAQWIQSQKNLLGNKGKQHTKSYTPKQIINVDLGNNAFGKEFSYMHPCIVIHNEFRKVFVVPCTSRPARRDKKGNLYPETLEGKGGVGGDGFSTTTTVLLNEARFIDKTRITDELGVVSDTFYKKVYDGVFSLIFESKSYTITKLQERKDELEKELELAKKEIVELQMENQKMQVAIDEKEK